MTKRILILALIGLATGWIADAFQIQRLSQASAPHITLKGSSLVHGRKQSAFALRMAGEDDPEDEDEVENTPKQNAKKRKKSKKTKELSEEDIQKSKEDIVKAVGETMKKQKASKQQKPTNDEDSSLLDKINPFKAGQKVRQAIGETISSISSQAAAEPKQSKYYLDDRFLENTGRLGASTSSDPKSLWEQDDYVPEVLVVGATGEVGRLVVRRLLLTGRCRVRVLVRDLYTQTLNLLGTGVTYCQGDLNNMDSLEYALTDVDKLVFCAEAPRPDEEQFQKKFQDFMKENLEAERVDDDLKKLPAKQPSSESDLEWEQLDAVLQVRAELAEQIDSIGMQNLVRAYQDVRHADYGTSQAAKRSLFKFQDRPEDFNLFALDEDDDDDDETLNLLSDQYYDDYEDDEDGDDYDDDYSMYDDYDDDSYSTSDIESRRDESTRLQTQWIRNQFEHGVFVGRVPTAASAAGVSGEAAIVSTRLRSRDNPDAGIDLGTGFAGFIIRLCADGGTYEAFVRTGLYASEGIEYVCEFSTSTKAGSAKNKSRNKFATVRLPFENFKPVRRSNRSSSKDQDFDKIPPFKGRDVRNIGFRYRASRNELKAKLEKARYKKNDGDWTSFYLALCYIKLYRSQPEPEIVYLSDARIPRIVRNGMVRHEARRFVTAGGVSEGNTLLDESALKTVTTNKMGRSPEETYFKFRGEEILKNSGLSYAIVRVPGFNESPTGESSTIDLTAEPMGEDSSAFVSRDEVAQVCVSALLDPNALNKSFYVSKKKKASDSRDENMSSKFAVLPTDEIPA